MTAATFDQRPPDPPFYTGDPSPAVAAVMAALGGIRNPHGRFPSLREKAEAAVAAMTDDGRDPTPGEERAYVAGLEAAFRAAHGALRDQGRDGAAVVVANAALRHGVDTRPPAIAPTAPAVETRPSCPCPVNGYSIECHRGDHRQNAADDALRGVGDSAAARITRTAQRMGLADENGGASR